MSEPCRLDNFWGKLHQRKPACIQESLAPLRWGRLEAGVFSLLDHPTGLLEEKMG
ncbi:hypothetical protein COO91_01403 [Nostoc flagelliforme CCNUN1]|uniref:Uncharacterized protein n=1 Tax=Nostoc flagelliforme CCNUN1 TaxID=2038116 RepID=A0A2K8SJQ2_9NOSO|nr:hypothetical protein COO91_01403 [Nostoc flagelliforme CCNUN1]